MDVRKAETCQGGGDISRSLARVKHFVLYRWLHDKIFESVSGGLAVILMLRSGLWLYAERIFEDHENLVENLLNWTRDSQNRLMFTERIEKYALFKNPQVRHMHM